MNYYNENDPKAAAWLRELIIADAIAPGFVDERSIEDVKPDDLKHYTQCHFFAGIGGWSYALRLAGWPDTRPVWTGSCPCQLFSSAGQGKGEADERHLWPELARLTGECGPANVFGEQVASKDGREWLAGVFADLDGMGYRAAAADLCAAGVGAPHIRQRLFWVADTQDANRRQQSRSRSGVAERDTVQRDRAEDPSGYASGSQDGFRLGHTVSERPQGQQPTGATEGAVNGTRADGGLDDAKSESGRRNRQMEANGGSSEPRGSGTGSGGLSNANLPNEHERTPSRQQPLHNEDDDRGYWSNTQLVGSIDGKARRIKPGLEPLVNGVPGRMGLLRGYGNAIVPQVAQVFVEAYMET